MFGKTPPEAIVTPPISLFNSSSLRTASWMWRGIMRLLLLSRAALPANSKISAHKYSNTAAMYTGAPAPILEATRLCLMYLATLPTGNCKPALALRLVLFPFFLPRPPFPFPDIFLCVFVFVLICFLLMFLFVVRVRVRVYSVHGVCWFRTCYYHHYYYSSREK